jgi:hypothetical protein
MNPTVTIHSDAIGVTRTITLTKTGADTGHITIVAPGNNGDCDVTGVQADAAALSLSCAYIFAEIDLSVQRGAGGNALVATVVVSHTLIGSGTYVYPVRAGEDRLVQDFLVAAAFPPPTNPIVVARR